MPYINGKVGFGGTYASDVASSDWTSALRFNFIDAQWGQRTGDFAPLYFGPAGMSTPLHRSDTQIADFIGSGNGVTNFSFDLTSITFAITNGTFAAYGEAVAHVTGFNPTLATWTIKGSPLPSQPQLYVATAEFTSTGIAAIAPPTGVRIDPSR